MEEGATLCGGQPHLKVAPLLQGNVFFGKIPWPRPTAAPTAVAMAIA